MKKLMATALVSLFALTALPSFAAETYDVDNIHSSVIFKTTHFNNPNYGFFTNVGGTVVFDDKNPAKSSVDIIVKTDSVYTANEKRDGHLKSPDFFNSKQFPEITFKSKKVSAKGKNSFNVEGDLTLHGVTKTVKVVFNRSPKTKGMKGEFRSGGETTLKLKRSDFGMKFMPQVVSDEVNLIISVEGIMK